MRVLIKICGITSPDDAAMVVAAGADAIGLMFFEGSPRFVSRERARQIADAIPAGVRKVGVFVNADADVVRALAAHCGLDTLQFHGEETPEYCRQFAPLKVWKALAMKDRTSLSRLAPYDTEAWLLDACVPGLRGGTGASFNWKLAVEANRLGRPIVLAGGLTPANVAEALQRVQPWGVDVSSGVESAPGRKDPAKVLEFVRAARGAPASTG